MPSLAVNINELQTIVLRLMKHLIIVVFIVVWLVLCV